LAVATRSQDGIVPGGTSALFRNNREDHDHGELLRYLKDLTATTFRLDTAFWAGETTVYPTPLE